MVISAQKKKWKSLNNHIRHKISEATLKKNGITSLQELEVICLAKDDLLPKPIPSAHTSNQCDFDPTLKVNCGHIGINTQECNERDCCWLENDKNEPFCFHKKDVCNSIPNDQKLNCWLSDEKVDKKKCIEQNCCYQHVDEIEQAKHVPLCYSKKMDLGSAKLAYDYLIKQIPTFKGDEICNLKELETSKKKESAESKLENVMEEMNEVGNDLNSVTIEASRKLQKKKKQLAEKLSAFGIKVNDNFDEFDSSKKMKEKDRVFKNDFLNDIDELSVSELVASLDILSAIKETPKDGLNIIELSGINDPVVINEHDLSDKSMMQENIWDSNSERFNKQKKKLSEYSDYSHNANSNIGFSNGVNSMNLAFAFNIASGFKDDFAREIAQNTKTINSLKSWYYPRASLILSHNDYTLSHDFLEELKDVKDKPDETADKQYEALLQKFGSHFCTMFVLGGEWQSQIKVTSKSETNKQILQAASRKAQDYAGSLIYGYNSDLTQAQGALYGFYNSSLSKDSGLHFEGLIDEYYYEFSQSPTSSSGTEIVSNDIELFQQWKQSLSRNNYWRILERSGVKAVWEELAHPKYL
eukprot:Pgem_evm1s14769